MMETPWTIVIGLSGFVFAGRVYREGDKIVIDDAYICRRYSLETKDGIGGLALRSPKKDNDVLDACPTVRLHVLAAVGDMECANQDAWSAWHTSNRAPQPKAKK